MKFRQVAQKYMGEHTINGVTEEIPRTRMVREPVLPRDWDLTFTRAALGGALALTLASIAWSTYAIGGLLGGPVGYIAAGVFDVAWLICLALEYLARFDPTRRQFPRRLGWFLLAGTMAAIGIHGLMLGSIPAAIVGAFVSLFAKSLWHGVMRHMSPTLSPDDAAYLAVQASKAHTAAAVANVRRTAARLEQRAALDMLAIERDRAQVSEAFGLPAQREESAYLQIDTAATDPQVPVSQSEVPAQVTAGETEDYDPPLTDLSKAAAVRAILARHPHAEGPEVVAILDRHGVEITTRDVANVRYRQRKNATGAEVVQLRKTGE